jgi:NADH dehydrogenase
MQIFNVCVLGGTGFIGRHVCDHLAALGYRARVLTRRAESAKALTMLPTVDLVEADVHDPAALARWFRGQDAVINLVGVLNDGRGRGSFEQAHVELAGKVVAACGQADVKRLLHMSALNADPRGPSAYLRSKGVAESEVRQSSLAWTIFRPSVVFGPDDRFLNMFARMQKLAPVVPLACPDARFQPVYVDDVAAAFVRSLALPDAFGETRELCGPKVYTLRELVRIAGKATGHPRPVVGLGHGLSLLQAAVMEHLPGKLLTRDNVRSMERDSVCGCPFPFGIRPVALEAVLPAVLGLQMVHQRLYRVGDRVVSRR